MEKQDINLTNLFRQLGNQSAKVDAPDVKLKNAVFSTIDATSLVADIVDLFTAKFLQTQSAVVDVLPENDLGFKELNEKDRVLEMLQRKFKEKRFDTEG